MNASAFVSGRNKRGRGYNRYCYTTKDVAALSRRSIWSVRRDIREGRLDIKSVVAVGRYVEKFARGKI